MEKKTSVQEEVKKQHKDLLNLLLKKNNTSHAELVLMAEKEFISANLDMVTPTEKKKFNKLVLK